HALDGRPRPPRPPTARLPLPGGEAADLEVLVSAAVARGAPEDVARHLADRDRALGRPVVAGRPEIWAEVAHAVEREMAMRLADVLVRRLRLFYTAPDQGLAAAEPVAERLAAALGWDAARCAEEVAAYRAAVVRSRAFAREVAGREPT